MTRKNVIQSQTYRTFLIIFTSTISINFLFETKSPLFSVFIDAFLQRRFVIQSPVNVKVNCEKRKVTKHNGVKNSSTEIVIGETVTDKRDTIQKKATKVRESLNRFSLYL